MVESGTWGLLRDVVVVTSVVVVGDEAQVAGVVRIVYDFRYDAREHP